MRRALKYLVLVIAAGALLCAAVIVALAAYSAGRTEAYSETDATLFYEMFTGLVHAKGGLRTDRAPEDAPFTPTDLAENFLEIALQFEDKITENGAPQRFPLKKWGGDIRYIVLGESVQGGDREEITAILTRIGDLTGLRVTAVRSQQDANFEVIFVGKALRRKIVNKSITESVKEAFALSDRDRALSAQKAARNAMTLKVPCNVLPEWGEDYTIQSTQIRIKAELPEAMRVMCITEEISQAFGLYNDSDHIRPTIFNDDAEFLRTTMHDEMLLEILYDDRLKAGMTAEEIRPLLPEIIEEIWRE